MNFWKFETEVVLRALQVVYFLFSNVKARQNFESESEIYLSYKCES